MSTLTFVIPLETKCLTKHFIFRNFLLEFYSEQVWSFFNLLIILILVFLLILKPALLSFSELHPEVLGVRGVQSRGPRRENLG
jgi:hypothetical protein